MRKYQCKSCGAEGVKLWRDYGWFDFDLFCVDCACQKSDTRPDTVREDGTRISETHFFDRMTRKGIVSFSGAIPQETYLEDWVERREVRTDQIGGYVPAIEEQECPGTFWGYLSWTEERKSDWDVWAELPLRKE